MKKLISIVLVMVIAIGIVGANLCNLEVVNADSTTQESGLCLKYSAGSLETCTIHIYAKDPVILYRNEYRIYYENAEVKKASHSKDYENNILHNPSCMSTTVWANNQEEQYVVFSGGFEPAYEISSFCLFEVEFELTEEAVLNDLVCKFTLTDNSSGEEVVLDVMDYVVSDRIPNEPEPEETWNPEWTEAPSPSPTPSFIYGKGDLDSNGVIDATDALMVLKHAAKLEILEDPDLADVSLDENVDAHDALIILMAAAKLLW